MILSDCYLRLRLPLETVGLTTGITPDLSESSKSVLMLVMFTGRVGFMTVIGTWALRDITNEANWVCRRECIVVIE